MKEVAKVRNILQSVKPSGFNDGLQRIKADDA